MYHQNETKFNFLLNMKTTKIKNGLYLTENNFLISKENIFWVVKNETTGEIYATYKTKKEAISYTIY